jgi:hypothetical protein
MLLRRLLGLLVLIAVACVFVPAFADDAKDKAVTDAKAAVKKAEDELKAAEKAVTDEKDDAKKKDLQKKADDAKKAVDTAKEALKKAEDAAKTEPKKEEKKDVKANLKWKFEKGKDFYQSMETVTNQDMTVMGNKVSQKQTQTFYFKWTFVDEKDGKWTIKQKIEGVKMDIDIGNQKITYDSQKDATATNNPLAEFFKALVNAEFTFTLDTKTMKVEDVKGRKEFLDALVKTNPQMKPLLEQILSENALKQMAEPTFAALPNAEKTTGDKWNIKTSLDMGPIGKYDNEYNYEFKGKKDAKDPKSPDMISVATVLKYTPPADAAGSGTGGLPFKIKSADLKSSDASGEITYNPDKGRIEESNMSLKLDGKLSIEIGGQVTDVTLAQTQTSKVKTSDSSLMEKK